MKILMCINLYFRKLLFIKAAATNLLGFRKKETPTHRCFPVKFAKFLRTLILKNICKWLLLYV